LAAKSTADCASQTISTAANGVICLLKWVKPSELHGLSVSSFLLLLLVHLWRNAEQRLDDFCHVLLLR
jgi:hypothetical protein